MSLEFVLGPDEDSSSPRIDHSGILRRVDEEFACAHTEATITRLAASNGVTHFPRQCMRCGANLGSVKKSSLTLADLDSILYFDRSIGERWQRARSDRYEEIKSEAQAVVDELRGHQQDDRRSWYRNDYLASPRWKAIRRRVLQRSGGLCEGCRERPATQVHHLSYEHVGDEFLFELVAVCDDCHARIHQEEAKPCEESTP